MKRLLGMLVLGGLCLGAGPATVPAGNVDLNALIKRLASSDYAEREDAAVAVTNAYPTHRDEIEAASKRTDLAPQAVVELQQIVAVQKPRLAARERSEKLVQEDVRQNSGSALDAYGKVGIHNPAWDASARELIETFTFTPGDRNLYRQHLLKMAALSEQIRKAGCKDPLIRYFMARAKESEPGADMGAVARELKDAVDDLESSSYPTQRKCWAHARYVELILRGQLWGQLHDWRDELGRELDLAVQHWPETAADPALTDAMMVQLASVLEYDWIMCKGPEGQYGDRAELCDKLLPAWQAAKPKSVGQWVFKGSLYISYAWDARGGGWANTVTEDGWKKMAERLTVAKKALERAYDMDPADPRGPTLMLSVELGQGQGRGQMELWWMRAMEANPDNYDACSKKLYYLEPKWHGCPADMIGFGRECLKGGNWEGRIPFILTDAHWQLSQYAKDKDAYFAQPEVWHDMRSVYEPYLARHPESTWDRSYFAYYATRCGQWEEARKQFELLGDKPELKPFGTREAYDYLVQKAKTLAKS